jgi:hypothetical protein
LVDANYSNNFWRLDAPDQSPKMMPHRYSKKTCLKMLESPQVLQKNFRILGLNPKYILVQNAHEVAPESYVEEIDDFFARFNQIRLVNEIFALLKNQQTVLDV